jgi:hypothetical protein
MSNDQEYRFVIDHRQPTELPMKRLAEYMKWYAQLLGEPADVHFDHVEVGSTSLVALVAEKIEQKVHKRLLAARSGDGPPDASRAIEELDTLLADNNSTGQLRRGDAQIIPFRGIENTQQQTYGPLNQDGTVDGILIRIGGKDQTAHANIDIGDGATISCEVSRDLARDLAQYLYGPTIRFTGTGRYRRTREGIWDVLSFRAGSFTVLDDAPLSIVTVKLRRVTGQRWSDIPEPLREISVQRADEDPAV